MRALFVEQDHGSPLGPVGERFEQRGYDIESFLVVGSERFHTPDVSVEFPDPLDYDVIVAMGAPWSVYDTETIGSWIDDELKMLRSAHEADIPVLGVCFGGQAMAAALGGSVHLATETEIGWYEIETDEPDLIEPGPWFQFHADAWQTPPDAIEIARGPNGPQAFRLGRTLALQFHPEVTIRTLDVWRDVGDADGYMRARGFDPEIIRARTAAEEPAAILRTHRLVDRFIDRIAIA